MSFAGFSEDDIRKLKTNQDFNKVETVSHKEIPIKKVSFKSPNPRSNDLHLKKVLTNKNANVIEELPDNAKLSTPVMKNKIVNKTNNEETNNSNNIVNVDLKPVIEQTITVNNHDNSIRNEKKLIDLEQFEAKQKLIEEQNKRRKELLAKALADRTKQTQEEAQRLNEIQNEFKKLDDMLSNDVKILRKQIELASIDYTDCQKRYHKIEKEFLEAKLVLHQKLEKKEMLTEHLCTIIEKNEERKAEKLTELLQKLQLSPQIVDSCNNAKEVEVPVQYEDVSSTD